MRYLSPIIWTIAAVGTFYVGFAAYDVYKDAQKVKKRRLHPNSEITWNDVESGKTTAFIRDMFSKQARDPPSLDDLFSPTAMSAYFNQLSGPEKLKWGALGLNTGFFALSTLSPDFAFKLCHVPVLSRNYTLLTCTFGHTGLLHLGMNMYCLLNFFPPVANSKTFEGNSSHLAAFYLSSGVVASLAYHLSAGWPSPALRYAPGLGASGVIYAFLGAFGVQYPEAPVGIIFLPFSFAARDALAALALFDAYGLFVGYKSIKFAHAAHLGGMAVGAAYVYLDGKNTLWKPARKVAFRQMKMLGMI
ncbi:hypothetical protein MMC10_004699 [Thelotrema lepadinum]|nr:hypothetical protein [Thelotrema lepadinum]